LVLAALAVGTTAGCGSSGEAAEEPPAEVSTTRRSDNDAACDQLRLVAEIHAETARLSAGVARQVAGGARGAAVVAAADELAAHLSANAQVVAAAYTDAAADAPQAVAAAIAELAAASAASMPALAELLGSATSADVIADFYGTVGAAGVADDVDPGAVAEVARYISVICDEPSPG
jgi:hypothetical protein